MTEKKKTFMTPKPPPNWRETMSRAQKAFHNKWNTETKPYIPTPKSVKS